MKIKAFSLDDEELPESIVVEMTLDEAVLIYKCTGYTAPLAATEALGDVKYGNALNDVAECLSGAVFNRFWDAGVNDLISGSRHLGVPLLEET